MITAYKKSRVVFSAMATPRILRGQIFSLRLGLVSSVAYPSLAFDRNDD